MKEIYTYTTYSAPYDLQNFNRYSYCLNNPLKYSDPSGYKWKWWQKALGIGLLIDPISTTATAFAGMSTIGNTATATSITSSSFLAPYAGSIITTFTPQTHWLKKIKNAWNIDIGMYRAPKGEWWRPYSRISWEKEQTGIGIFYSHFRNILGNVDRVDYFDGAIFCTNENSKKRNGITLGNYININNYGEIRCDFSEYITLDPMYMHEFGHTIQSRNLGFGYLFAIGLPSLYSATTATQVVNEPAGVITHDFRSYEINANKIAGKYFGENYGVEWDSYYIINNIMRRIETYYPTQRR